MSCGEAGPASCLARPHYAGIYEYMRVFKYLKYFFWYSSMLRQNSFRIRLSRFRSLPATQDTVGAKQKYTNNNSLTLTHTHTHTHTFSLSLSLAYSLSRILAYSLSQISLSLSPSLSLNKQTHAQREKEWVNERTNERTRDLEKEWTRGKQRERERENKNVCVLERERERSLSFSSRARGRERESSFVNHFKRRGFTKRETKEQTNRRKIIAQTVGKYREINKHTDIVERKKLSLFKNLCSWYWVRRLKSAAKNCLPIFFLLFQKISFLLGSEASKKSLDLTDSAKQPCERATGFDPVQGYKLSHRKSHKNTYIFREKNRDQVFPFFFRKIVQVVTYSVCLPIVFVVVLWCHYARSLLRQQSREEFIISFHLRFPS